MQEASLPFSVPSSRSILKINARMRCERSLLPTYPWHHQKGGGVGHSHFHASGRIRGWKKASLISPSIRPVSTGVSRVKVSCCVFWCIRASLAAYASVPLRVLTAVLADIHSQHHADQAFRYRKAAVFAAAAAAAEYICSSYRCIRASRISSLDLNDNTVCLLRYPPFFQDIIRACAVKAFQAEEFIRRIQGFHFCVLLLPLQFSFNNSSPK